MFPNQGQFIGGGLEAASVCCCGKTLDAPTYATPCSFPKWRDEKRHAPARVVGRFEQPSLRKLLDFRLCLSSKKKNGYGALQAGTSRPC